MVKLDSTLVILAYLETDVEDDFGIYVAYLQKAVSSRFEYERASLYIYAYLENTYGAKRTIQTNVWVKASRSNLKYFLRTNLTTVFLFANGKAVINLKIVQRQHP